MAHQTSAHVRRAVEFLHAGLLRDTGREPGPTFALVTAQEAARSAPAGGAVATDHEIDTTLGQGLHQPGGRETPVQDQHIAPEQPIRAIEVTDRVACVGRFAQPLHAAGAPDNDARGKTASGVGIISSTFQLVQQSRCKAIGRHHIG